MNDFRRLLLFALILTSLAANGALAQPKLKWGGDKNGGAPYIFEDDKGNLVGFEVELAEYLGKELGSEPVFVQDDWDLLPNLLLRKDDLDVVLNGYEFEQERHKATPTTVPYYVYSLRLITRKNEPDIRSWADLGTQKEPKKVGVLKGSASERYLESRYGDKINLQRSVTVTEMFDLVRAGTVDVTVQDAPAAAYYIEKGLYPELKVVDEPVGFGFYVMLTHKDNAELRDKLNEAIRKAIKSGFLRSLYQKYGLWNSAQQRLSYLSEQPWPAVAEELDAQTEFKPLAAPRFWSIADNLVMAAGMTLFLAFASFPLASALGLWVAIGRVYGPWIIRTPLTVYVEVLRGTPLLLQLFVIFYLPTQLGAITEIEWLGALSLNKYVAAILGLALNYSAAEAENYRAGILAVPRGQMEAALSLGFSPTTAVRRVILPQAIRIVIPPVTNDFIALFKDTAVCSTIMIVELTGLYYQYKIYPNLVLELALAVGILYLMMSYPLSLLARYLEHKTSLTKRGGA